MDYLTEPYLIELEVLNLFILFHNIVVKEMKAQKINKLSGSHIHFHSQCSTLFLLTT